jgi:L-alanine-DL-glutamate epimerase-like enolase superfamily enzyme
VKVSGDIDADLDRIIAVHLAAPGCAVRIDANQSLTPNDALQLLDDLLCRGVQVELLEQPTPRGDLEALDRVARQSPVPVFADEAVLTPAEARRLVSETCVHGINVKLMKSGFGPALEIVEIARGARRDLMIGCMLETRRGIGAALAFACGTDAFRYADLDSHLLLAEEGANSFFREEGPYLCPLG